MRFRRGYADKRGCCKTPVQQPNGREAAGGFVMERVVDGDEVARILAAKAYLIVRQAKGSEIPEIRRLARHAASHFSAKDSPEAKRRAIFYHLILAELDRRRDPLPHRDAAMELAEELDRHGEINPFPFYLQVVEATTEETTTAHFGDFNSSPAWSHSNRSKSPVVEAQENQANFDRVLDALKLAKDSIKRHDRFLWRIKLPDILKHHGLSL